MSRYKDYSQFAFEDDLIDEFYYQNFHQPIVPVWKQNFNTYAPAAVLLVAILYATLLAFGIDIRLLPRLAWNVLVYFTPWRVIHIFEKEAQAVSGGLSKFRPNRSFGEKNATMKRIVGLDKPGNLVQAVAQAGKRRLSMVPGVSAIMSGRAGGGPAGLGNYDNSCYQNSVLQGLASLNGVSDYLKGPLAQDEKPQEEEQEALDESPEADTQMANSLRGLIAKLNDPSNNGKTIWTPQALKSMSSWTQQDAQEYFSNILDSIDKEFKKVVLKERRQRLGLGAEDPLPESPEKPKKKAAATLSYMIEPLNIGNPLEGLSAQRVGCTVCGHSNGLSMTQFNCVTLPLPGQGDVDIRECLDEYTSLESIKGVQCGKCTLVKNQKVLSMFVEKSDTPQLRERLAKVNEAIEKDDFEDKTLRECQIPEKLRVTTTKSRQAVIARPPRSLVLHVNRSMFDERTGDLRKNYARVIFDTKLDLGPWCLGSIGASTDKQAEAWILNPAKSMISGGLRESLNVGPFYELKALVMHQGRHENGHYVAYKRFPTRPTPVEPQTESDEAKGGDKVEDLGIELNKLDLSAEDKKPKYNWYRLSDDDVELVDEDIVLSQGGVFMLFYDLIEPARRIRPGTPLSPEVEEQQLHERRKLSEVYERYPPRCSSRPGSSGASTPANEVDRIAYMEDVAKKLRANTKGAQKMNAGSVIVEGDASQPSSAPRSRHTSTADSDRQSFTSATSSPSLAPADDNLEPVQPIIVKPYQGWKKSVVAKVKEREDSGGMLMT